MHFPTDNIAHTTAIDGPVVVHWLEWKSSIFVLALNGFWKSALHLNPPLPSGELGTTWIGPGTVEGGRPNGQQLLFVLLN